MVFILGFRIRVLRTCIPLVHVRSGTDVRVRVSVHQSLVSLYSENPKKPFSLTSYNITQAGNAAKKTTSDEEIHFERKGSISNSFWNIEATRGLTSSRLKFTDRFKATYS